MATAQVRGSAVRSRLWAGQKADVAGTGGGQEYPSCRQVSRREGFQVSWFGAWHPGRRSFDPS